MDFSSHKVLVTGGTGSFGRQMTDYLLDRGCNHIRILSRDEAKQEEMRIAYANDALKFYIGDVRSRDSVKKAMRGVNLVFHAAALKQVPSCEFFPLEAMQTNVIGSANVVDAAVDYHVQHVVCLSTDKAVMPINAMGMSKALMEKTVQAMTRSLDSEDTIVSCVRYGNVMYSRGSVIPLFVRQIKQGQQITVTEESMTRFLLALPDAIGLVEFAFEHATQGDTFIRKAPACTVGDLAQSLMEIFEASNPIKSIGMRHGEKLFETLATAEEVRRADNLGDYFRIRLDTRDLNYSKYFTEGDVGEIDIDDYNSHNTKRLDRDETKQLLMSLPEIQKELVEWQNRNA